MAGMIIGSPQAMRCEPSLSPPYDCAEEGHDIRVTATTEDGDVFWECRICGEEGEC